MKRDWFVSGVLVVAAASCWCGGASGQYRKLEPVPTPAEARSLEPIPAPVEVLTQDRGTGRYSIARPGQRVATANDRLQTLAFFVGQEDQNLGLTLSEANDELRKQLDLPEGQGVVVSSLAGGGPADLAGLKLHDILLRLGEKPIGRADDLTKLLKEAGEKEAPLELLRAGKKETVLVKPVYRVTLAPAAPANPRTYIGLTGGTMDETLRSHLRLPPDRGFPVNSVIEDGPAAKAGVKAGDIILTFNGWPVRSVQELSELVQANEAGKAVELEVQRGRETRIVLGVTPEPWKQQPGYTEYRDTGMDWDETYVLGIVPGTGEVRRETRVRGPNPSWVHEMVPYLNFRGTDGEYRMAMPTGAAGDQALKQQLESLQAQVKDLKAMLEKLNTELEQSRKQAGDGREP